MNVMNQSGNEQAVLWNGAAGQGWVEAQELLDRMFQPFEDLLVAGCSKSAGRVLDVGCGAGATTLAVARAFGANGSCTGIDISAPLIAAARARRPPQGSTVTFLRGDAQTYPFEPAGFDRIISRFGVMFFDQPVRAFENLRRAAAPEAALQFIAWRSAAENPFMTTAERAAAPLLADLPVRRPDAPGQFAFADSTRIEVTLKQSGWAGIDIRPIDVACTLPEKDLVTYFTTLGPAGQILRAADHQTRARIAGIIRNAFDPYVCGPEVRFTAACWMVTARAGARGLPPE